MQVLLDKNGVPVEAGCLVRLRQFDKSNTEVVFEGRVRLIHSDWNVTLRLTGETMISLGEGMGKSLYCPGVELNLKAFAKDEFQDDKGLTLHSVKVKSEWIEVIGQHEPIAQIQYRPPVYQWECGKR